MIDPPIILRDSDGYLGIFDSIEHAEVNLDPDDLEVGEYIAFDSRGRLLEFQAEDKGEPRKQGGGFLDVRYPRRFRLVQIDEEPSREHELRVSLARALELSGLPETETRGQPLPDLVREALGRRKGTSLP